MESHITASPQQHRMHTVQFYDMDAALLASVHEYVRDGLEAGEAAVVIATEPHRRSLEALLTADGVDLDTARASERFVALDADEMLATFMRDGHPDPALFSASVGSTILRLAVHHSRIWAFGEMVDILAGAGQFDAAMELESIWNDFQTVSPLFSLLCAYRSVRMDDTDLAQAVCQTHTDMVPHGFSLNGSSLETLEVAQAILGSAPREPQPLAFFSDIAARFGLSGAQFESTLRRLEVTGDVLCDPAGHWYAPRS